MTVKVILFDFDGTLAETFEAIVRITNRLSTEFGYKPVTPEEIIQLKQLSSRQVIQQSGLSIFKLPLLLRKIRAELNKEIYRLNPVPGIQDTLIALHKRDIQLGIITTNAEENVRLFLKANDLDHLFSYVHSEPRLFGKWRAIKSMIHHYKLSSNDVVYVGDETRDIDAVHKIKIRAIAVTWGFNSPEILAAHNPDFLIDQPQQLLEVVEKL